MKKIWIGAAVFLLAGMVVGLLFLRESRKPKTFSTAEALCVKVLENHRQELEALAAQGTSGTFREYAYHAEDGQVCFSIGSQGMLGGQYWELIYTADGTYAGEITQFRYEEPDGNNIVRAKHLTGNWWYRWTDYDGTEKSWQ